MGGCEVEDATATLLNLVFEHLEGNKEPTKVAYNLGLTNLSII